MKWRTDNGSTLAVTVITLAMCSVLVGIYIQSLLPKYRSAHQATSWRDAMQGAEAGINHGIYELNRFAASNRNSGSYPWAEQGWSLVDAVYSLNGERILAAALNPVLGGSNNVAVTELAIDVYTRQPTAPYHPWFRIRSTGKADLPDRFVTDDRRDGRLRRMKLAARAAGRSAPHVTRTVEVIVKPRHRFSRAITTVGELALGSSADWHVDSFDSTDPNRSDAGTSAGGVFPRDIAERGSSGNIASARTRPRTSPYGELIYGNGARVAGQVQTVGGDDPATVYRENVSDSRNMDQSRIRADFDEQIAPARSPSWLLSLPAPLGNTNFMTGTEGLPARYVVVGDLAGFQVVPPLPGTTGYVEILVKGNLNVATAINPKIVIPPNVNATVYVDGNINFGSAAINSADGSSKVASHLTVFGISTSPFATYNASGTAQQILGFYGPNYVVTLDGAVTTVGAMVAKSLRVAPAGAGGFHYDEALGKSGDITGWVMVSYFEDTRGQ